MIEASNPSEVPPWMYASGEGVTVGVIDSGWNRNIRDHRVLSGVGLVDRGGVMKVTDDDHDSIGHGTACAALLLSLAPGIRLVPLRVFGSRLETRPRVIEQAVDWAIDHGINMLNLSLGTTQVQALRRLYLATQRAHEAGVLIVAAAGTRRISYPAAFESVISVGARAFETDVAYAFRRARVTECLASGARNTVVALHFGTGPPASSFAVPRIVGLLARALECIPTLDLAGARTLLERYAVRPLADDSNGSHTWVGN